MKKILSLFFAILAISQFSFSQVSAYSFSQSTATFTPITGGTVFSTTVASTFDEQVFGNLPIGFTFKYNGVDYTSFGISSNGWISMGSTTPVTSTAPLSSGTTNNVISAVGRDLYGRQFFTGSNTSGSPTIAMTAGSLLGVSIGDSISGTGIGPLSAVTAIASPNVTSSVNSTSTGTGRNIRFHNGKIRYETIGTAPNRKLVVQWSKFSRWTTSAPSDFLNFQIVLNETSGTIEIIYDFPYVNATGVPQVGLRGATSADFNNRTTTTNWASTTAGTSNTSTCSMSNTIFPASGLTFTWTAPTCFAPTGLTNSAVTNTTATHTWTAPSPAPSVGYEWAVTTSATPPASGTATTALTANSTGLTPNTTYYLHVRSDCGSGTFSGWATSASFTTQLINPTPYNEPFTTITTPAGYNISGWTIGSTRGVTGNPGNNIYKNFFSSATTGTFSTVNIGPVSSGQFLYLDYKHSNYAAPYAAPGTGTGSFVISLSTDFGASYSPLATINNSASNTWSTLSYDLSSYAGQNVKIKIDGTWVSGDWDLAFDNIKVEAPPSCLVPSALTNASVTTNSASHSWTAPSPAPSVGYEWAVTTSATPPASGTATTALTANSTGLTPNTTYYLHVRSDCGSGSFSSWATSSSFFTGYCTPAPSSVDGSGITNVTFGQAPNIVNNTTVAETGNYGNYSAQIGDVQAGVASTIAITYSTGFTYDTKIWIDFNNDLDFVDVGEEVYVGTSTSSNPTTLNATITIPSATPLGNYRMRIGGQDSGPAVPCYTGSYGTFEDYTVNVVMATPCSGAPAGVTLNPASTTVCGTGGATLIASTTSVGTGITYVWESSPAGTNSWAPISGANASQYIASGVTSSTDYRSILTCSGNSTTSPIATITVEAVPVNDTVCGAITLVEGGTEICGNTTCATSVGDPIYSQSSANNTVWFKYTPSVTGTAVVQFSRPAGVTTGLLNGWLGIYTATGSCPGTLTLTEVPSTLSFNLPTTPIVSLTTPSLTAGTTYYFMIDGVSGAFGKFCIKLPACAPPTGVTSMNVTTSSADISWTAPSTGVPTGYKYVVSTTNASPTTAGTFVSTTTASLSGLTEATVYYVYVRSICGSDSSAWTSAYVFATACNATNVPYIADGTALACISLLNNNAGTTWGIQNTTPTTPSGFTVPLFQYNYSTTLPGDDYLFTQGINLTAGISYKLKYKFANNSSLFSEKMDVRIGTDKTVAAQSTVLKDYPLIDGGTLRLDSVTFTVAGTGVYYISFRAYSDADQYYLYLDDIKVTENSTCSTVVSATNTIQQATTCAIAGMNIVTFDPALTTVTLAAPLTIPAPDTVTYLGGSTPVTLELNSNSNFITVAATAGAKFDNIILKDMAPAPITNPVIVNNGYVLLKNTNVVGTSNVSPITEVKVQNNPGAVINSEGNSSIKNQ